MAMDKVTQKDIDWLLKGQHTDRTGKGEVPSKKKKKRYLLRFTIWTMLVITLVIFPFFLLIRLSLYLNIEYDWNAWLALGTGMAATIILLMVYLLLLFRRVKHKKLKRRLSMGSSGLLVLGFCIYGIFYLSGVNAKDAEIQSVYRSLHPVLRVAVATTTLADPELIITDISRSPEDYISMGLAVNEGSRHFKQEDGFVHAIDLRTIGRSPVRNFLLEHSLKWAGLFTLRHSGTADHLHVALPARE